MLRQMSELVPTWDAAVGQDELADGAPLLRMVCKQRQHGRVLDKVGLDNHTVEIEDCRADAHGVGAAHRRVNRAGAARRPAVGAPVE